MKNLLIHKLHSYLIHHNPELVLNLTESNGITEYLTKKVDGLDSYLNTLLKEEKPSYIIQELCMNALTEDLRPSKYIFIKGVFEEEFSGDYMYFEEAGTLLYELINLITVCNLVFKELGFTEENENNRILRYAIIGQIREYLIATD